MDQIMDATVHIEESIDDTVEGCLLDPQERDSYVIGLPIMDALGMLSPLHQWPIFVLVKLVQPNLIPLLQDIPEKTTIRIGQAV